MSDANSVDVEWFVSDVVLTLGMLGTIIGFMIMLQGTFSSIEFNDVHSIRLALSSMSQGLFTALNTTLLGLVSSIILKVQLILYENVKDNVF
jgi:biopolymer transport protein ExbB/TolQ